MFYNFCRKKRTDYRKTVAASLLAGLVSGAAVYFLTPTTGSENRKMAKKKFKQLKKSVIEIEKQAEGQVIETSNEVKSRAQRVFENLKTAFQEPVEDSKESTAKAVKKTSKKVTKKAAKVERKASAKKDSDDMYS